jgi:hypothetical protein
MPAAPYDDPSIPVLTERLTLPELDLDITLPAFGETRPADAAPPAPATAPAPAPAPGPAPAPPPAVLDGGFESDDLLVETIPMAPAPLDPLSLDLPAFELPPLTPTAPAPAGVDSGVNSGVNLAQQPAQPAAAFTAADVVIPASLMRPEAPAAASAPEAVAPRVAAAPTFDRLPAATPGDILSAVDLGAANGAAFAVAPAAALPDEDALREAVVRAVLERLPQQVETIVRRQLAPAVDAAIDAAAAQLATEIRRAAAHALRDLVGQAVRAELDRWREPK